MPRRSEPAPPSPAPGAETRAAPGGEPRAATVQEQVHAALKTRLICGGFRPGEAVSLRSLAQDLGTSAMPVRDAVARLVSDGALELQPNRRVAVPRMSPARFEELMCARVLLEPELAARALPRMTPGLMQSLRQHDLGVEAAMEGGDIQGYMRANHAFHFALYAAAGAPVLLHLVEGLWLQFGPFMRLVYGRWGTAGLIDQHERALLALSRQDEALLRDAIRGDIVDGMTLMGRHGMEDPRPSLTQA